MISVCIAQSQHSNIINRSLAQRNNRYRWSNFQTLKFPTVQAQTYENDTYLHVDAASVQEDNTSYVRIRSELIIERNSSHQVQGQWCQGFVRFVIKAHLLSNAFSRIVPNFKSTQSTLKHLSEM